MRESESSRLELKRETEVASQLVGSGWEREASWWEKDGSGGRSVLWVRGEVEEEAR